jgi:hypothetical protein
MDSGIVWDNPLPENIRKLYPKLGAYLGAATTFHANKCESYMRTNASWTDQTGNARNGLFARPFSEKTNFGILLFHTVPYGIWLETRFNGRYAIIDPTIREMGPDFMDLLNNVIGRAQI